MADGDVPFGRAFVSYAPADRDWAVWISWQLERDGWQVDVQAWDVVAGANVVEWMQRTLQLVDHLVLVVSQAALDSAWVGAEWQAAFAPGERRLVPVRVEPVRPAGLLASLASSTSPTWTRTTPAGPCSANCAPPAPAAGSVPSPPRPSPAPAGQPWSGLSSPRWMSGRPSPA